MTSPSDSEIFAACAAQRRVFADLIASLDTEQLAAPSLCANWSNREVAGHLASAVSVPIWKFFLVVFKKFGNLNKANDYQAAKFAALPQADLVKMIRGNADKQIKPPGIGARGPMSDVLIHTGDVVVALGLPFEPDLGIVERALDFLHPSAPGFAPKKRLQGLTFAPTDLDRTWGTGSSVSGRAADVMMAMAGRSAVLDQLSGDGLDTLRARLHR